MLEGETPRDFERRRVFGSSEYLLTGFIPYNGSARADGSRTVFSSSELSPPPNVSEVVLVDSVVATVKRLDAGMSSSDS